MKYLEEESSTLEFKENLPKNNQILKTIIGFCNQNGGKIIIGVEDDGTIKGLTQEEISHAFEYLDKAIYQATCPPIIPLIYAQTITNKTILIIEVCAGMNKPYYICSEGLEKGTYVRLGRSTLKATFDIIQELQWTSHGRTFDSMPVYQATVDDLNYDEIRNFFKSRKASKELPADFNEGLLSYNIIAKEHGKIYPTIAGILIFGKDPQSFLSEAMIICSRFAGISGREVLATRDIVGTLPRQIHDAFQFILSQINRSFVIKSSKRNEKYEIPPEAIREAIVNAVIHRNYHINGPLKIAIYDNRIEIFSPGVFFGPLTQKNYKSGLTYIRNIYIAKILREMGYVEKLGTGLTIIFNSYEKAKLQQPELIEGENFVKYILPRASEKRSLVSSEEDMLKDILKLFEFATSLSSGEIINALNIPKTTAIRKLNFLVSHGHLKKKGAGSSTKYFRNI